jgi:hypothetical protein
MQLMFRCHFGPDSTESMADKSWLGSEAFQVTHSCIAIAWIDLPVARGSDHLSERYTAHMTPFPYVKQAIGSR